MVGECVMPKCRATAHRRGYCRPHYNQCVRTNEWPIPTCIACGEQLIEPANRCGFCIAEAQEREAMCA